MKLLGKLRNRLKNKKGFTLVELIVVIVIIAILAALVVPAVMNYIEKAKDQQVIADARSLYIASQTVATEEFAAGNPMDDSYKIEYTGADLGTDTVVGRIAKLGTVKAKSYEVTFDTDTKYDITNFVFKDNNAGRTASYTNDTWVLSDNN